MFFGFPTRHFGSCNSKKSKSTHVGARTAILFGVRVLDLCANRVFLQALAGVFDRVETVKFQGDPHPSLLCLLLVVVLTLLKFV